MGKRTIFMLCVLLMLSVCGLSQDLKIGLWKDGRNTAKAYYHSEHPVTWLVDNDREITIEGGRTSYFTVEAGGMVKLSIAKRTYGRFKRIRLLSGADDYILKSLSPERTEERYNQGLEVRCEEGSLHFLNYISDIDSYVAGVVESESGKEQDLEFYKAQAVICRTYALSNIRRHEAEGFHLCDQVHCQVYHGVARFQPLIHKATDETSGQVLVDSDLELITASFHSNCGGETVNSEDVWSKALPYLRAKEDTFCLDGVHAHWESRVLKSAWDEYMEESMPNWDGSAEASLYTFAPDKRVHHYPTENNGLKLKLLRHKWRLNSTYFDIEDEGEALVLRGRGFGHGVGMCQEGAMGMCNRGYDYQEILLFYYTDVHLVHQSVLDFFKEN